MGRGVGGTGGTLTLRSAEFTPPDVMHLLQVAALYHFIFPLHHRTTPARMDPGTSRAALRDLLTRSNPPVSCGRFFLHLSLEEVGKLLPLVPSPPCHRHCPRDPPPAPPYACHIGVFVGAGS